MAVTVLEYKRGDRYVKSTSGGKTAHGLVGELWVHGLCYDTIERMDGYVALDGGRSYPHSTMYWHKRLRCYVVNPWHHKTNKNGVRAEILMHKASRPSHLQGCIGPGILVGTKMTLSTATMAVIWEQCGGTPGEKKMKPPLRLTLKIEGDMKRLQDCKPLGE